jgi:hypothetical protein
VVATIPGGRVSSRRLGLFIALAAAALIAVATWAFPKLFKPVTEQVPLPPTGEAAYNPLYALKLALRAQGREAQAQRILDWVRGGGHLVMPGPPGRADAGPLASAIGLRALEAKADKSGTKAHDEIEDLLFSRNCVQLRAAVPASRGEETWLCDPPFAPVLPGFRLGGGDAVAGWRVARREHGRGRVTLAELD